MGAIGLSHDGVDSHLGQLMPDEMAPSSLALLACWLASGVTICRLVKDSALAADFCFVRQTSGVCSNQPALQKCDPQTQSLTDNFPQTLHGYQHHPTRRHPATTHTSLASFYINRLKFSRHTSHGCHVPCGRARTRSTPASAVSRLVANRAQAYNLSTSGNRSRHSLRLDTGRRQQHQTHVGCRSGKKVRTL